MEVLIVQRQLAYLGHAARYLDSRLERIAIGLYVAPESSQPQQQGTKTHRSLRTPYWERIQELMALTDVPEVEWAAQWQAIANKDTVNTRDVVDDEEEEAPSRASVAGSA